MRINRDAVSRENKSGYHQVSAEWVYDIPFPAYPVRLKKSMPNKIVKSLLQASFRTVNLYRVINMRRFNAPLFASLLFRLALRIDKYK